MDLVLRPTDVTSCQNFVNVKLSRSVAMCWGLGVRALPRSVDPDFCAVSVLISQYPATLYHVLFEVS